MVCAWGASCSIFRGQNKLDLLSGGRRTVPEGLNVGRLTLDNLRSPHGDSHQLSAGSDQSLPTFTESSVAKLRVEKKNNTAWTGAECP